MEDPVIKKKASPKVIRKSSRQISRNRTPRTSSHRMNIIKKISQNKRVSRKSSKKLSRKRVIRSPSKKISRKTSKKRLSRKTPVQKKVNTRQYLIQKRRSRLKEKIGKKYVRSSRTVSKPKSRSISSHKSKNTTTQKEVSKPKLFNLYSGTIIYSGDTPLNPFKWSPSDPENSPVHPNWDHLSTGTHILDQNTRLTWIIKKKKSISLAPCQTIKLDLEIPKKLENFNPGMCLNPFLPEITKIPQGTRFYFNNTHQTYYLNSKQQLEVEINNTSRAPQVIPIPFNSLYNTQNLVGLNIPIQDSSIQKSSVRGYRNLNEWLHGLVSGSQVLPGYLGTLPNINQIQANDILEFYDPNTSPNPHNYELNPDGSNYISDLHESRYFNFRMRVILDKFDNSHFKLSAEILTDSLFSNKSIDNINQQLITIPLDSINLEKKSIPIKSIILVSKFGQNFSVPLPKNQSYFFDGNHDLINDSITFIQDRINTMNYPYNLIKVGCQNLIGDQLTLKFNNLPTDIIEIIISSDQYKLNKYGSGGQLFIGHSYPIQADIKSFNLDLNINYLTVNGLSIDNFDLEFKELNLRSTSNVELLLSKINHKLAELGYGSLSLWWSQGGQFRTISINEEQSSDLTKEDDLRFYFSLINQEKIPSIIINLNGEAIPFNF